MGKQSGLLKKQKAEKEAEKEAAFRAGQNVMKQYMFDTFCVTMHEDFGFGYKRIKEIEEKWGETFNAYFDVLSDKDEADVMQVKLDRAIQAITGDHEFYPFEERYPEVIRRGYERRRR